MKSENKRILSRPSSCNQESQKQKQDNSIQNEHFLKSIKNLHKQIEELKNNQLNVSQSLTNNLTTITKKIDVIESFINELSSQSLTFSANTNFFKLNNIMLQKSQIQKQHIVKPPQMTDIFLDQQKNNKEKTNSLLKVQSNHLIQADRRQISIQNMLKKTQSSNQPIISYQQQEQNILQNLDVQQKLLKFKQCYLCQSKSFDLIETPCDHFFHKKCLKQLYDQQLMDYENKQQFHCICEKKLPSNLFSRNLQIDKETLFQKQLQIIQQKYKNKIKQCRQCNFIWILNIFQKTNENCVVCGGQFQKW